MIFIRFGVSHKLTSTIPAKAGNQRTRTRLTALERAVKEKGRAF
jgi:hypothetical protein